MKALIVAAGLLVGCSGVGFAQDDDGEEERARQPADAHADQLEALLKKLVGSLRAKKTEVASEALRSLVPNKEAVEAALTKEGFEALGGKVQAHAKEIFGAGPQAALEKLGITPEFRKVDVFSATTEDLKSMEAETTAAREFASGLRTCADHLKPATTFYCARLYPRGAEDDPQAGVRLQLFYMHEDRFVYLGPLWKLAAAE